MLSAAMMHVRVGSALLTAHFGSDELPAKRAKRDETREIICEMNDKKARVTFLNDDNAIILVFFESTNSLDEFELLYDDLEQNIDFDAHIALLYASKLQSGMIREMLCELFKKAVARGYVRADSNIYLDASGDVKGSFSLLIQMYQRMSFVPIGIQTSKIIGGNKREKYTLEKLKRDMIDKKEVDRSLHMVLMATNVHKFITWCDSKFQEDRNLLSCDD